MSGRSSLPATAYQVLINLKISDCSSSSRLSSFFSSSSSSSLSSFSLPSSVDISMVLLEKVIGGTEGSELTEVTGGAEPSGSTEMHYLYDDVLVLLNFFEA